MKLNKLRRLAAQILKVGETRIWFDPSQRETISEALTKEDVRGLIKEGLIKKKKAASHSRGRARILHEKKKKGRKKGMGKRSGTYKARAKPRKKRIASVRAQRKKLRELKEKGVKLKLPYGKLYRRVKGGYFRGKKHLETMVEGKS